MKKISRTAKFLALFASFCVPLLVAAQINTTYIKGYSTSIISIINNLLMPVLMAIAFITFLWGVYRYFILGADNETQRETGRQFTLWGIIGFVVILSLWGIVNIFMNTLGLTAGNVPAYPTLGAPSGSTGGTSVFSSGTGGTTLGNTGGVTPAQNTAYSTLTQQYSTVNSTCGQYGTSSNQCSTAGNAYTQSLNAYNAMYSGGSATPAVNGVTCSNGQIYDSDTGTCVNSVLKPVVKGITCTGSEVYDSDTGTCVKSVLGNPFSTGSGGTGGTCSAAGDLCDGGTGTCGYDYSATGTGNPSNTPLTCLVGYFRSTSHVDGTSCETTTIDGYAVSGTWSNGTCGSTSSGSSGIQSGGDCTNDPNGCASGLSCISDASDIGTCQ